MRMLMAAFVAAAILATAAPASAKHFPRHERHAHRHHHGHRPWPPGWRDVPLENVGGACPKGDCSLLATR